MWAPFAQEWKHQCCVQGNHLMVTVQSGPQPWYPPSHYRIDFHMEEKSLFCCCLGVPLTAGSKQNAGQALCTYCWPHPDYLQVFPEKPHSVELATSFSRTMKAKETDVYNYVGGSIDMISADT